MDNKSKYFISYNETVNCSAGLECDAIHRTVLNRVDLVQEVRSNVSGEGFECAGGFRQFVVVGLTCFVVSLIGRCF